MDVLIDSSVWVDYLRGAPAPRRKVNELLLSGRAAIAGPVFAEVTSGARTASEHALLKVKLAALNWLEPNPSVWTDLGEARFTLARLGVQAHMVDLLIALTAHHNRAELLTMDRDFRQIARVLPLAIDLI